MLTGAAVPVDHEGVVDGVLSIDDPHVFRSQKGVVLGLKKISKQLFVDAGRRVPEPVPPKYESEPGRWLPNTQDPEYIRAVEDYRITQGLSITALLVGLGTFVKEVPEGIEAPESATWVEDLAEFGIEVPTTRQKRYVTWLRHYVLVEDEFEELFRKAGAYSGLVFNQEVAEATAAFSRVPERGADRIDPLTDEESN